MKMKLTHTCDNCLHRTVKLFKKLAKEIVCEARQFHSETVNMQNSLSPINMYAMQILLSLGEWNFSLGFHFYLQCTRRGWRQTFFPSLLFIVIIIVIIISGSRYYVDIFPQWVKKSTECGDSVKYKCIVIVRIHHRSLSVYASKCCAVVLCVT